MGWARTDGLRERYPFAQTVKVRHFVCAMWTLVVVTGATAVEQSKGQASRVESEFERQLADLDSAIGGSRSADLDSAIGGSQIAEPKSTSARTPRRVEPCECPATEPAFNPADFVTNVVEIATDPTCGWCRRQHGEVAELRRNGWDVRYAPFPLGGPESAAGIALAAAKCLGNEAIDRLMETGDLTVDASVCASGRAWVADGKRRLRTLGVHATPTLVIGDSLFEGYRTAAEFGKAPGS